MSDRGRLGIVVGGGPAPGINSVIAAATIHADRQGVPVLGIRDGFGWIMASDIDHVVHLDATLVAPAHFRGGSILGTGRANPTKQPATLESTLQSLGRLGIDKLITIGGDDTAYTAMRLASAARAAHARLAVVHVPKTIDNDLDLPGDIDTFGFDTARHLATELAVNLFADAETMSRWFFVVAMGRKAGHLALGVGAACDADITVIGEEWPGDTIPLADVVDVLAGSILKRRAQGRRHGLAVIAEGIFERVAAADLADLPAVGRDEHGNIRLADIDIGRLLKTGVSAVLEPMGIKTTIVTKEIGYELRCTDPGAHDMFYSRELGFCAAQHILDGGTDVMVSVQGGRFVPIPFTDLVDPATGRTRVRFVDTSSLAYQVARRYMTRLTTDDFADVDRLAALAGAASMTPDAFRVRFERLAAPSAAALGGQ